MKQKQILATEQWGSRPHRSAVDALFVLSRIMADAGRILDTDPIVIDMMDIKKAYPNCSRNAMDESLKAAGTPEKVRKMMAKLDSGTLYKCRSPTGLSEPYQNMRGTREGCPAAPVKFNVLHHYATNRVRDKWHVQGLAGVGICTFSEEMVWQDGSVPPRSKINQLKRSGVGTAEAIELVGYADDTTLLSRLSQTYAKRASATEGYEEMGHKVHPDKWCRLWSGSAVPPPARDNDRFEMNSKVLGSFLESDGGFDRECTHRIMRGGTVWAKLKK